MQEEQRKNTSLTSTKLTFQDALIACIGYLENGSDFDFQEKKYIERDPNRPLALEYELMEANHHYPELGTPVSMIELQTQRLRQALRAGDLIAYAYKLPRTANDKKEKISPAWWGWGCRGIDTFRETILGREHDFVEVEFIVRNSSNVRKVKKGPANPVADDICQLFDEIQPPPAPETTWAEIAQTIKQCADTKGFNTSRGYTMNNIQKILRGRGKYKPLINKRNKV